MKRNSGMMLTTPMDMTRGVNHRFLRFHRSERDIYHQLVPHPRDEMIHEPYSLKNEYGVIRVLHGS